MSTSLAQTLEMYLALRRALGTRLRGPALHLRRFVEFMEDQGAAFITTELALRWATAPAHASAATCAQRLGDVRRFAAWLSATDGRTQVPPAGLLRERFRRRPPYLYSENEIARLLREATGLPSPGGLRGHTYATLFGLLAATGLRVSEALALDRDDVDLAGGLLSVQHTKFGKSRWVPVHVSTCQALRRYALRRDQLVPHPVSSAFLLSERGTRLTGDSARYIFALVSRAVGLRPPVPRGHKGRGPRLHDLRHGLAVQTLLRWYREGRDVERELPKLSTYLGHAHVADTYWYLQGVPELLLLATERVTRGHGERP
ncbi:MAG: tyrosine-type recombinase/integrase [Candidatus Berkelbacteria bacterium]|nr:tyrosine-type recombinase/integrase [Candidatus Berkelbacteria bacterium]